MRRSRPIQKRSIQKRSRRSKRSKRSKQSKRSKWSHPSRRSWTYGASKSQKLEELEQKFEEIEAKVKSAEATVDSLLGTGSSASASQVPLPKMTEATSAEEAAAAAAAAEAKRAKEQEAVDAAKAAAAEQQREQEEKERASLLQRIKPGTVFINNKPGSKEVFGKVIQSDMVDFKVEGKMLFKLPLDMIFVDDALEGKLNGFNFRKIESLVDTTVRGQCVMLFGPSGSGKTTNANKILESMSGSRKLKSIHAYRLYGNAEYDFTTGENKIVFSNISVSDTPKQIDLKRKNYVDQVSAWLSSNEDGGPYIRQTANNIQSSRCCVAYQCVFSDGTRFVLVDGPGNESPGDLIRGMFAHPNMNTFTEEQLVEMLRTANDSNSFHGFEVKDTGSKLEKLKTVQKLKAQNFSNDATAAAFYPLGDSGIKHLQELIEYCKILVKEALYINLLIGEMSKRLKEIEELIQTMPLIKMTKLEAGGAGTFTACLECSKKDCKYQQVRFAYIVDDCDGKKPPQIMDVGSTHKRLRSKRNLNDLFPFERLVGEVSVYSAVVVTAHKGDERILPTLRNATYDLTRQLFGELPK